MKRCMLRKGQRNAKGLTPVYLKDGGRVVGYICEMWGKNAGWFWRTIYNGQWSELPVKSQKLAITEIGNTL